MPDFTASPLVDALEENLFSLLEKLAAEVNTEALPLIDLSSGSPDQPTPPEVIDSLQSAIHRRENHGYPSFWGKPQVREAIARFYRREYDVELDPHSEIAVFQGSHIGIGGIPRALLSPGQYHLHRSLLSDLPLGGAAVPGGVLWPAAQGGEPFPAGF